MSRKQGKCMYICGIQNYWGDPERAPHRRVECSQSICTTCIIIDESAKHIHSVCLSFRACLEKGQVAADSDRDRNNASIAFVRWPRRVSRRGRPLTAARPGHMADRSRPRGFHVRLIRTKYYGRRGLSTL